MQVSLRNLESTADKQTITISEYVFGQKFNESLIHQVVTACLSNARAGTKAQKNRAAVRGGGKKPWKQKGTGRARAGTIRSPLWRKGGVIFAASPRDFSQKINKKMYRAAVRSIFSELHRQNRLCIVDNLYLEQAKTKDLIKHLSQLELSSVLIITDTPDINLILAARNLHYVEVCTASQINPARLLSYENVMLTGSALKIIQEMFGEATK